VCLLGGEPSGLKSRNAKIKLRKLVDEKPGRETLSWALKRGELVSTWKIVCVCVLGFGSSAQEGGLFTYVCMPRNNMLILHVLNWGTQVHKWKTASVWDLH